MNSPDRIRTPLLALSLASLILLAGGAAGAPVAPSRSEVIDPLRLETWGDYSGSVVDGDNLTDLWTIQSITDEKGKGDTVIAKVPFAGATK